MVEHRGQNRRTVVPTSQPTLLLDDVVGEDGVIDGIRVPKRVIDAELFVASRIMQERRRFTGQRGPVIKAFLRGDASRGLNHLHRVDELQLHHRREMAVRAAEGVDIGAIGLAQGLKGRTHFWSPLVAPSK